jgi:transcriptional regulator with XRE-family HTH domain
MNIARRLASLRRKRGLSQARLAELMGVKPGTVAGWETQSEHHHGIRMERLERLAKILGVTVQGLFR